MNANAEYWEFGINSKHFDATLDKYFDPARIHIRIACWAIFLLRYLTFLKWLEKEIRTVCEEGLVIRG